MNGKFDLDLLKSLPILAIASRLGIEINKNKSMCFNDHDKKTPSLHFNSSKNVWHCFGCGQGGDNIRLVQQCLQCSFIEACSWLYAEFNFAPSQRYLQILRRQPKLNNKKFSNVSKFQPDTEIYEWLISSSILDEKAYRYLTESRRFSPVTLKNFRIKSLSQPKKKIVNAIEKWGFERVENCGLVVKNKDKSNKFIWWSPVILFPFYDLSQKVVYIQARQIEDKLPKYINLHGLGTTIFNLQIINELKPNEPIYICEGITDVISMYEQGCNAVGILGASGFKKEWVNYFVKFQIYIVPDNDKAGSMFAQKVHDFFLMIGKPSEILMIKKEANDFTELVKDGVKK